KLSKTPPRMTRLRLRRIEEILSLIAGFHTRGSCYGRRDGGAGQRVAREDRRRDDGLQEGARGQWRRYRSGRRLAEEKKLVRRGEKGGTGGCRGPDRRRYPRRRRCHGGGQFRDRFCGAQPSLSKFCADGQRIGARW